MDMCGTFTPRPVRQYTPEPGMGMGPMHIYVTSCYIPISLDPKVLHKKKTIKLGGCNYFGQTPGTNRVNGGSAFHAEQPECQLDFFPSNGDRFGFFFGCQRRKQ